MKKKKKEEPAETHPDLKGLTMGVNKFGQFTTNISLERINDFLDKHVVDKKLNEEEWLEKKKGKRTSSLKTTVKGKGKKK